MSKHKTECLKIDRMPEERHIDFNTWFEFILKCGYHDAYVTMMFLFAIATFVDISVLLTK